MLENREWYAICNEAGGIVTTPDPSQDANGHFPNREHAEAAAKIAFESMKEELYIVSVTRTTVSCVTGSMQVVVTPV